MNVIVLVLLIVTHTGEARKAEQKMDTMEECLTSVKKFLDQDPDEFNAKMIAASCNKISVGVKS